MHWRLTVFEKKRIEAIALDHPYFDGRRPLLTKKEMAAIVKQGASKTGCQVIAEAMAELGLPYTPAESRKRTFREALGDLSFAPGFRRGVALLVLAAILLVFLTATAPGHALAESVYTVYVTFKNKSMNFWNASQEPIPEPKEWHQVPEGFETPYELAALIQMPILVSEDEAISFQYSQMVLERLVVQTRYRTGEGQTYDILQNIYGPKAHWDPGVDARGGVEIASEIRYEGDLTLFAGVSEDGAVFLTGYGDDFDLTVTSTDMTLSELEGCMKRIFAWEDSSLKFRNEAPSEAARALDFSLIPEIVDSPGALAAVSGFPILISEDEIVQFRYSAMSLDLHVRTRYRTPEGDQYVLSQCIYGPDVLWGTGTDAREVFEIESEIRYDGPLTLYAGTATDGTAFLDGFSELFTVHVSSTDLTLPELESCMSHIYAWQKDPLGCGEFL